MQPQKRSKLNNHSEIFSIRDGNSGEIIQSKVGIVNIVAGYNGSTYILFADGSFAVYGYNAYGQLGINTFDYVDSSKPIWCKSPRIDRIFCSISAKHSFCLTHSGDLYACGKNNANQFGMHTTANCVSSWTQINHFAAKPKIAIIAASEQCTFFLLESGQLFKSENKAPFVKPIKTKMKFKDVKCSALQTLAISAYDDLYLWDDCNQPEKMMFFAERQIKIKAIDCGMNHCMVLTKYDGKVYCFGYNDCYQFGNGVNHRYFVQTPQRNKFLKDEFIVDIKCGAYHNMAMNEKNEYFFWGSNGNNECMVYADDNADARLFGYEEKTQFVTVPTKYEYDRCSQQIIEVYLGHNSTQIVWQCDNKKGEDSLEGRNKNKVGIKQKWKLFKSWLNTKKNPRCMVRKSSESLSPVTPIEMDDDDEKYADDEYYDALENVNGLCLEDRMSRKSEIYEEEEHYEDLNGKVRTKDGALYTAVDIDEC